MEGNEHPTLGKQRSNYNVLVKYSGVSIGFITFYNTFTDKKTGHTIDILNMDLDQFRQLFNNNGTAAQLAEFQQSYKNALMFHNYIT
jgi:hypothetical protein